MSKVTFSPCFCNEELFVTLAKDYIEELAKYDCTIKWDEEAVRQWAWNSDFILEDGELSGFVYAECPTIKDDEYLYIAEFYIIPKARRHGIGYEAVRMATEFWDGNIFLYILDRNETARNFWTTVEQRLGWKRIEEPEIIRESGCELRVFEKEKGNVSGDNETE